MKSEEFGRKYGIYSHNYNSLKVNAKVDGIKKIKRDILQISGHKYLGARVYFAIAFIFLVAIFIWLGTTWVKSDNNPRSVEEGLKSDLLKDPVKPISLPSNQSFSSNQSQNVQTDQTSQVAENTTQTDTSQATSPDSTTNTDNTSSDVGGTTPENSDTKTFESTVLKVSFDYPSDTTVAEGSKLITVSKNKISWKIRFYDNKNKKDFQTWYTDHFNIKTTTDCTFTDAVIKVGLYDSKLVKPNSDIITCDGDGNYATSTDKSRVVKIEPGKETIDNVNKILTNFKFTD